MYGRNRDPNIKSIDDILKKKYSIYGSQFSEDSELFFKNLYSKNELLTPKQTDSFIKIMIRGKSRSLLRFGGGKTIIALNRLTERHILTSGQVSLIINCIINYNDQSFKWVDNLILLGYQLSDLQRDKLIAIGYQAGIDLILNKETSTIDDLNGICNSIDFNLDKIDIFFKKFGIIPTLKTLDIVISKFCPELSSVSYGESKFRQNFELAVKKLIEYKLVACVEVIHKIYKFIDLSSISDYIDQVFNSNPNKIYDMSVIGFMFNREAHSVIAISNVKYILSKCKQYSINIDLIYLKQLMIAINKYNKDNMGGYDQVFDIKKYTYVGYIFESQKVLEQYYSIINKFLEVSKDLDMELLEHASYISDRLVFDILINKINKFTDKCVSNACSSGSVDILNTLFNMKALPTLDCVKSLSSYNHIDIFNLLLKNGLPINTDTIEAAFIKNIYISNLEDYGYKPDLVLYEICHKYRIFPWVYILQLENNLSVQMDIRLAIKNYEKKCLPDNQIIDLIKLRNIIPDLMMYTEAVISNKSDLVEYFENECNMKPNLDTLILIENLSMRREYLKRIIECHNIKEDIISTVARPKSVEIKNSLQEIPTNKSEIISKKIIVRSKKNIKVPNKKID